MVAFSSVLCCHSEVLWVMKKWLKVKSWGPKEDSRTRTSLSCTWFCESLILYPLIGSEQPYANCRRLGIPLCSQGRVDANCVPGDFAGVCLMTRCRSNFGGQMIYR
jgi:hypothetical protein